MGATETLRNLLPSAFRAEVVPDRDEISRVAAGFPLSRGVLTRTLPPRIHSPALAHNWAVANQTVSHVGAVAMECISSGRGLQGG